METYQRIDCDDEKVVEYCKAIVKAVKETHTIAEKCKRIAREIDDAIQSNDKDHMMNVLQNYIHKYYSIIEKNNRIKLYYIDRNGYEQMSVEDMKKQLYILKGIVYDCEAKQSLAKDNIKNCLKKILKASGKFSKQEIELLLS